MSAFQTKKLGSGYHCRKCNHEEYSKGERHLYKRCKSRGYHESPTTGTLFDSVKLSLPIVFEMVYLVSVSKNGISCLALSREYNINPKTAYHWRSKIQQAMKSSQLYPMKGKVYLDEFVLGGEEERKPGRSTDSKNKKVNIAVETKRKNKKDVLCRVHALPIENYGNEELSKIFDIHISRKASIETGLWKGYKSLKKTHKINQTFSVKGADFHLIHAIIMNFKSWISGTHKKIYNERTIHYLNEFCFRFNRKHFLKLPIIILNQMVNSKPCPAILTNCDYYK